MFFDIRHHLVNVAQLGISAGRHDQTFSAARTHRGAGKQQIRPIAKRQFAAERLGAFFHHRRFTGQNRLFHPQIMRFDHPQVGRYSIARADHHDIAGDQSGSRDRFMITLTNHHRFTGEHVANALERFFRITLLDMSDQRINHRHAQNHQGIYPVAHDRRQQRRRQQDVNQHIIKMRQKAQPRRLPGLLRQRIFTILLQARRCLGAADAFRGAVGAGQRFVYGELIKRAARFFCIHSYLLTPVTEIRTASGRPQRTTKTGTWA